MRTLNTLKNVIGNFASNLSLNLLRFVSRIIFIKCLNEVYLGVNGLLSNVLGLLALSELGISTAINYSLYKPLEEKDENKIRSLMNFYKKAYTVIALVVTVAGIVLLPFLPHFIKDTTGIENLSIIYLIFLANMVIGYLFGYKRTLITADQKSYKITPFLIFFNFLTTILQIIVLLLFKHYIIYLLMQTICIILEHIFVNRYIEKEYPYIKNLKNSEKLDSDELGKIKTNVKALLMHQIGTYVFLSTDNLIISKFIGIVTVGIYSNYVLVVNMIKSFISTLTNNAIASVGNLIASKDESRKYKVFKEMDFVCFVLYGVSSLCFITLFTPFIEFCFGSKFLLDDLTLYLIVFNHYVSGMNAVPIMFVSSSGLYDKDKYVPLIQSIVNLVISIVLAIKIGIAGVLIGTAVSNLFPYIIKPYIIHKHILHEKLSTYFKTAIKQFIVITITLLIILFIINLIPVSNLILQMIINLAVTGIISLLIIFIVYGKTEEFNSLLGRVKYLISRKKGSE